MRIGSLAALLLLALPVAAQDKVELKPSYREGDTYDVKTKGQMRLEGNMQGQAIVITHEGLKEYREKVLAVEEGLPVRGERTYKTHVEKTEQRMGTMPPQVNEQKNAIVGKTVTIVKEGGVFKLVEKPAEGELKDEDLDLGAEVEAFLPESAVGVGESWTVKPERVKQVFGGENAPKKTTVTCTLQELTGSGADRKAKIHVKVEMEGDTPGGTMTMQMEGPMIFDIAAGKPLSMSVKGTAKMDTPMGPLEGPMEMEASLTPAK